MISSPEEPLTCFTVFLQEFGTATGNMTTTRNSLRPYPRLASPPTSMFTCRPKRRGWPSVSVLEIVGGYVLYIHWPIGISFDKKTTTKKWWGSIGIKKNMCSVWNVKIWVLWVLWVMCPPFSVIIISVVEAILLLTLIFLRTRILIAIALIQESSKSVIMLFSNASFGSLLPYYYFKWNVLSNKYDVLNQCVCFYIPQSDQSHDVLSAIPSGYLCPPGGVCCLLGDYRHVSSHLVFACVCVLRVSVHVLSSTPPSRECGFFLMRFV